MSERPNVVLGVLLATAIAVAGLVGGGMFLVGGEGAEAVGATLVGAVSACFILLRDPADLPFSSIVVGVLTVASLAGFVRAMRWFVREHRAVRALPVIESDSALAACAAGMGARLYVLGSARPVAFCAGLIQPRIVVSSGLLARLDEEEREAVVWHEAAHARARDPLKCLVGRLATETFFWMPLLRSLLERYLLVKEIAADRAAVAGTSRRALAGALAEVMSGPTPEGAIGFGEAAAARVDRLFDPRAPIPRCIVPSRAVVSGIALTTLVLALAFPATLDARESDRMWHMLVTLSPHGMPGMLAGMAMNAMVLVGLTMVVRRVALCGGRREAT